MDKITFSYILLFACLFGFAIYAMLRASEVAMNIMIDASKLGNGFVG